MSEFEKKRAFRKRAMVTWSGLRGAGAFQSAYIRASSINEFLMTKLAAQIPSL